MTAKKESTAYKAFGMLLFCWGILVAFGVSAYLYMNFTVIAGASLSVTCVIIAISAFFIASGMSFYTMRSKNKRALSLALGVIGTILSAVMLLFCALADKDFTLYAIISLAFNIVLLAAAVKNK